MDVSYSKGIYIGSDAFEKRIKDDYGIEKVARKTGATTEKVIKRTVIDRYINRLQYPN